MNQKFIFITAALVVSIFVTSGIYEKSFAQNTSSNQTGNQTTNNQTSGSQSKGANISAGAIGNASQLSQVLGNNSEILANNTSIGNPNASTAEKMSNESSASNQTGSE